MSSCAVRAYVRVAVRRGTTRRVLVGRGRIGAVPAGRSKPVRLTLTAHGRRLLSRIGGVNVELHITGRATSGRTLRSRHRVRLLPRQSRIVTSSGLFATDSAAMSASGRRSLLRLGRRMRRVETMVCTGYADSTGSFAYNEQLALSRARALCGLLRASHRGIAVRVRSAGENLPAASNRSAAGRARNRRVVVRLRYG